MEEAVKDACFSPNEKTDIIEHASGDAIQWHKIRIKLKQNK